MPADNCITILKSPDDNGNFQFRVAHAQAIENIYYDEGLQRQDKAQDSRLKDYFGQCRIHLNLDDALATASSLYVKITGYGAQVEYGIQIIEIDRPFPRETLEPKIKE